MKEQVTECQQRSRSNTHRLDTHDKTLEKVTESIEVIQKSLKEIYSKLTSRSETVKIVVQVVTTLITAVSAIAIAWLQFS
jgi:uncharacterized protein YoxC